ncbi:hypothetical protein BZM26_37335 [Paraburkholderia strydomiana]|nr:hypothetical protein BZM26_37335 [Paraburkholderia strydomiana]
MDAKQENGVITVSMLAKIRRMHFRDGVPLRDIARQTGLSRNTIRRWLKRYEGATLRPGIALLLPAFEYGEAFQFDWSCEYVFIGGLRRRVEVAHLKLAASRAFWLVAYPTQSHEMLIDAHARAFVALGGIPRRGIYE